MARLVDTDLVQEMTALMTVYYTNGSHSERIFHVNEMVENLRYVKDEELISISGRIQAIRYSIFEDPRVNVQSPVDWFSQKAKLTAILIDKSTDYHSDVVTIDPKEIVEFEGELNVVRVSMEPYPIMNLTMEYSDNTTVEHTIEIYDYLDNFVAMTTPGQPDLGGSFKVAAWEYEIVDRKANFLGMYLTRKNEKKAYYVPWEKIIRFDDVESIDLMDTTSMRAIANAFNSGIDKLSVTMSVDVNVPLNDQGRIQTIAIPEGKTLELDLAGHEIDCVSYAFYVTGGILVINDTTGNGKIVSTQKNAASATVQVQGGKCIMESGVLESNVDTSEAGSYDWMYGVVCSKDGVFEMTGGKMSFPGAAGISITNGTAEGSGAQFIIGGDAVISSAGCCSVYLADNKSLVVKDNAVLNGGVIIRMGDLTVQDNAVINAPTNIDKIEPLGIQVTQSGCTCTPAGILLLAGCYQSALGNDMNVVIKDNVKIKSVFEAPLTIAKMDTLYDQKVEVNVEKNVNLVPLVNTSGKTKVYSHDELAELAAAEGKTLPARRTSTDVSITIAGNRTDYPTEE